MQQNKMIQNANELAALILIQGDLKRSQLATENEQKGLELSLTPAEGWSSVGKNETDRKVIQALTFHRNERWLFNDNNLAVMQSELIRVQAQIEALQIEQDAYRWSVRNETNITLGGKDWLDILQDKQMEYSQEILEQTLDEELIQQAETQPCDCPNCDCHEFDDILPDQQPGIETLVEGIAAIVEDTRIEPDKDLTDEPPF